MDTKEAIEFLKCELIDAKAYYQAQQESGTKEIEALTIAVAALETQVPKALTTDNRIRQIADHYGLRRLDAKFLRGETINRRIGLADVVVFAS